MKILRGFRTPRGRSVLALSVALAGVALADCSWRRYRVCGVEHPIRGADEPLQAAALACSVAALWLLMRRRQP